jgi:Ca-activated chloride channel homolog
MMVGYGIAAWPFLVAKYGLHQRWRVLTALIGVAALLAAALLASSGARAATAVRPSDARSGSLILKTEGEGYIDAARLGIDVDVTVSGPTLRARVTQVFRNTTNDWVEAIYVYPLPDGGAVDTLKMVIGDRIVVGDIKERQQARVIYEQAKQNGQKAALTEQERPNIFTNAVANIGPGETVLVQIEYQEPLHQSGDQFSLRIPMVVGPRYNPAPVVQTVDLRTGENGWGTATNDPVPDRDRISPPVLDPRDHAPTNPTTISIRLHAGFPIGEVKSHFHNVKIDNPDSSTRVITLADGAVPADRDFELTWTAAAEKTPTVGLFREQVAGSDYLLAYVTPPVVNDAEQKPLPREVVFVIDNSGSMGGTSIAQAKAALLYALSRLQPNDRFNVIRFDNTMDVLFPDVVSADNEHLARANAFVTALQAAGGTEMIPPMRAALTDHHADGNTVRQVVFLTDGCIGNEQQLFRHDHVDARTLACVHGGNRLRAQFLSDDTRRRTRPRHLHAYRLGRAGRKPDARTVRQARKPGGDATIGDVLRHQSGHDAGCAARPLSRRTAGSRRQAREAHRHDGHQGPDRRSALERDAAARQRGGGQGTLKALGTAQDRGRGSRAKHAHADDG